MIKLVGLCGKQIYVNPSTVAFVHKDQMQGLEVTKLKFSGGASVYVTDSFNYVLEMMEKGQ